LFTRELFVVYRERHGGLVHGDRAGAVALPGEVKTPSGKEII
jgi:hypothetical protein